MAAFSTPIPKQVLATTYTINGASGDPPAVLIKTALGLYPIRSAGAVTYQDILTALQGF